MTGKIFRLDEIPAVMGGEIVKAGPAARPVFRPEFPKAIDSTMLKTFRSCPRKFQLEYLEHWKPKTPSIHLHAGSAFASGLEAVRRAYYERGFDAEGAVAEGVKALAHAWGDFDAPSDATKTFSRMVGALVYYFDQWPIDSDPVRPHEWAPGRFGIEFSFASPLPFDHPSGDPLTYTGRSDMLAEMNGGLYIEDDKTTSRLGPSWVHSWDMRSQFTGYCWSAKKISNIPVQGVLVRGISILKNGYEHAQVPTYRPDWQIARWLEQTLHDLHRMLDAWNSGYFDYNLDEACEGFSGCLFKRVCLSPSPDEWLHSDYERRVWDPLTREERPPSFTTPA